MKNKTVIVGIGTALLCFMFVLLYKQIHVPYTPYPAADSQATPYAGTDSAVSRSILSKSACALEKKLLVDVKSIDSAIGVELKYATSDNFTGKVLYEDLESAYLQPDAAMMLAGAQRYLQAIRPGLHLLVYDAARPLSVQQIMWNSMKDKAYRNYVARPDKTGLHNYGAAVDLTLADSTFEPLDMGTPFDYFGRAAGTGNEPELMEQGLLTRQQYRNRQLLRQVMHHAGFRSIGGEWWHFNACTLNEAKQRYQLIESFEP
jgi:D-alanyl-D-alanine dipeptidase